MSETVIASDGTALPLDSLGATLTYGAPNQIATISVVYRGNTYTQSFTWTGSQLTSYTIWEKV